MGHDQNINTSNGGERNGKSSNRAVKLSKLRKLLHIPVEK